MGPSVNVNYVVQENGSHVEKQLTFTPDNQFWNMDETGQHSYMRKVVGTKENKSDSFFQILSYK